MDQLLASTKALTKPNLGTPHFLFLITILDLLCILLNVPVLRQALSLIFLLIVPGAIFVRLFWLKSSSVWEYLILMVGFSIGYLYIIGLLLNQLFRMFQTPYPLSSGNVLWMVFAPILGVLVIHTLLYREEKPQLLTIQMTQYDWVKVFVCFGFAVLGPIGAIILNNGGSNFIAIFNLVLISVYVVFVTIYHNDTSSDALAISTLLIGLSLLLSYSLRSLHIAGWDINQEFYVFQLTKVQQVWNIQSFPDPYNACMSITILPTIFSYFLGGNDEYIFKVFYQAIFALVPLCIFLTARRYLPPIFAFLASMFFVFQPWFIQPAPALARQEIGFLFFALFIWATFNHHFTRKQKWVAQVVFGIATVLSHYSTAYIMLFLLLVTFVITAAWKLIDRRKSRGSPDGVKNPHLISLPVLLILFAFTFFWSNVFTQTSGNVYYVFQLTVSNVKNILMSDMRSEDFSMALLGSEQHFTQEDIDGYIAQKTYENSASGNRYPPDTYQDFQPRVKLSNELPGLWISPLLRDFIFSVAVVAKQATKVLLVLGAVLGIWFVRRSRPEDNEFSLLNLASVAILLIFIILPVLSLYYNLFRIYLQMLIVSSISIVLGFCGVFGRFKIKDSQRIPFAVLIVLFFISTNGIINFVVGGPVRMNLDNMGVEYDKFYTQQQEVLSARWLAEKRDPAQVIFADDTAALRLISFGKGITNANTALLPSIMSRGSYVYVGYSNLMSEITQAGYKGKQISYNYPLEFLNRSKSLLYDNGGSRIYK